uniref:Ubiquitin-like modifier-activating enzyme ATG7 (ATG12-activating enzyme E1 ATG7) (Autophagy-related protein 7) n=1 Tax=Ganoderma boninense TaxID=34458 RepID=A0A5K1K6R8_9APHY|nr:Ubiquitin-like modifier-activating enzyme ATG7 (ATG12-activating enzyme E1 ATG7) (Autophagy-related protein 7) [Ganoderma boninense]
MSTLEPSGSSTSVHCPTTYPTPNTTDPIPFQREPSPIPFLSDLRSLVIAYPDPEDGIFSLNLPNLTHLSLRDQPRVYHRLTADDIAIPDGPYGGSWPAPLLSSGELLSILRRMDLSRLTSLELVYMAHQPGQDDVLLSYIPESLPQLQHLELHRYRGVRSQMRRVRVDHMHIARLLSTATSLVTLRLNLDFHDDHQAYCSAPWERRRWFPLFKARGFEVVDLLQASCLRLQHVALLYHGDPAATWAEFHPQRCAEPRFVLDYTKHHVDSEPCPREWVFLDPSVIPSLLTL